MNVIKLTEKEWSYLCSANFLPIDVKNTISKSNVFYKKYCLEVSDDMLNEMRDLFGEQLQYAGFDMSYDLTEEGKILEDLIDKFFK